MGRNNVLEYTLVWLNKVSRWGPNEGTEYAHKNSTYNQWSDHILKWVMHSLAWLGNYPTKKASRKLKYIIMYADMHCDSVSLFHWDNYIALNHWGSKPAIFLLETTKTKHSLLLVFSLP